MNAPTAEQSKRGYPLIALFLLMAMVAILIVQLTLLRGAGRSANEIGATAAASGVFGAVFGLMIGLHDYRRARGAMVGPAIGFLTGLVAGPIAVSANAQPLPALVMAAASGVGLLLFTTIYRIANTKAPFAKTPRSDSSK